MYLCASGSAGGERSLGVLALAVPTCAFRPTAHGAQSRICVGHQRLSHSDGDGSSIKPDSGTESIRSALAITIARPG